MDTYPNNSTSLYLWVKEQCNLLLLPKTEAETGWESDSRLIQTQKTLCYLSWKKKTYVDPTHAMTQINQRMWQVQGPSSLSINLKNTLARSR